MKVTQISIGRFHHFHLARQMEKHGLLDRLWTGYPRFKLRDEVGIPPEKISSFPFLHTISMGWSRIPLLGRSTRAHREIVWWAHDTLDRRVARTLRGSPVLIALSGQGEQSGRRAQALGGWHICDRGSSHIRYQDGVLRDEHVRWKLPYIGVDPRTIRKEEAEYEGADLITVPSGFAERSFLEMGVPREKLRRIPYGSRLERFQPHGGPTAGQFDVLFVGQISLRKGLPYLLEAFSRLAHPSKRLRIVGSVDPAVEPLLARWPTRDVEFLGMVPNARLAALYSSSHVLVLPSVEEGLAMVMAEAMACGCPVIATPQTGAEDLFSDEVEGLIVPARSADDLLRGFERLVDDPGFAAGLRHAALARMRAMDGWNNYGRRWVDLLSDLPARIVR